MRRIFPFSQIVPIFVAVALVGCSGKSKDATSPSVDSTSGGSKTEGIKVAMVTDTGGIDDQSFNAGSWSGLLRAEKELGIPKPKFLESKEQNDYAINIGSLAEKGNDLVIAVGFLMEDALKTAAKNNPKAKFAIIDGNVPEGSTNAVSLKFKEEEGSFLAGYLAAKVSKKGTLGFVGGVESPLIKKFEVGYIAGARTANPAIKIIPKYVGNWNDNAKGQQIAEELFRQGADIIFAAAGKSGLGVLDGAAKAGDGYYAIGVDSDQDHIQKGHVLTSMMKSVDVAVFETVKALKEGKFTPGTRVFSVKDGGVHLSPMTYTKDKIPASVLAEVDKVTKAIADGKISVPSTDEQLKAFKSPTM